MANNIPPNNIMANLLKDSAEKYYIKCKIDNCYTDRNNNIYYRLSFNKDTSNYYNTIHLHQNNNTQALPKYIEFIVADNNITEDKNKEKYGHINDLSKLYIHITKTAKDNIYDAFCDLTPTDIYVKIGKYIYTRKSHTTPWDAAVILKATIQEKNLKSYGNEDFYLFNNSDFSKIPSLYEAKEWLKIKLERNNFANYKQLDILKEFLNQADFSAYQKGQLYKDCLNYLISSVSDINQFLTKLDSLNKDFKNKYLNKLQEEAKEGFNKIYENLNKQSEDLNKKIEGQEQNLSDICGKIEEKQELLKNLNDELKPHLKELENLKHIFSLTSSEEDPFFMKHNDSQRGYICNFGFDDNKKVIIWETDISSLSDYIKATTCDYGFINISPTKINSFQALYKAGLKTALEKARENNGNKALLFINNYNIIFPNSYMEPVFNIFNGLTDSLPNENESFPNNIYFVFIPFQEYGEDTDEKIGLPFNYKNSTWVKIIQR